MFGLPSDNTQFDVTALFLCPLFVKFPADESLTVATMARRFDWVQCAGRGDRREPDRLDPLGRRRGRSADPDRLGLYQGKVSYYRARSRHGRF